MIGQRGLPATFGGVERHVEEISTRLAARGHEVVVYCRRNYTGSRPGSFRGVRLEYPPTVASKHLDAFAHSGAATAHAMRGGFDIVHYHAVGPGLWAPIPRFMSRAKVVQTIHGLDQDRDKWGRVARAVLETGAAVSRRVPDAVIVVGGYLLEHYRQRTGLTFHIPNGVSLPEPGSSDVLDRLGLEPGSYALFVGRLTPEKAVHHLMAAFARVETAMSLVVAGGSSFTDGYEEALRSLATDDDRIRMAGFAYGADLEALYRGAALYVQPSLLEGVPLTVLEAAAMGIPLLLSDIPAHREVVPRPGAGARLFPPGDLSELAIGLGKAVSNAEADRAPAAERADDIRRRFDWDAIAGHTEAAYEQVLRS